MAAMNRYGLSRDIPSEVKQQVRIRCRFSCVMCGAIPIQYDHFQTPFAKCKQHDPEDIILLCSHHHDLKTKKLIDNADILGAWSSRDNNPGNFGFSLPVTKSDFRVRWPSVEIYAAKHDIVVGDRPVLRLELSEDHLQPIKMSGRFNDLRGKSICAIEDNEITSSADFIGDFELRQNRFVYKMPDGRISLQFLLSSTGLQIESISHVHNDAYVYGNQNFLQVGNSRGGVRMTRCMLGNRSEAAVWIIPKRASYDFREVLPDRLPFSQMSNVQMLAGRIAAIGVF